MAIPMIYNYLMGPGVLVQNCFLAEIFAALAALIRLFAGVDADVLHKNRNRITNG